MSCVSYSTSTWPGNTAWRTPLVILFSVPSVALLATVVIPESPRWLALQGRDQDALQNLEYLNDGREGFDSITEMSIIKATIERHEDKGSWADLFRGNDLASKNKTPFITFHILPPPLLQCVYTYWCD